MWCVHLTITYNLHRHLYQRVHQLSVSSVRPHTRGTLVVLLGRTVLLIVARWFVLEARERERESRTIFCRFGPL
jgi:hypothetical protein